MKLKNYLGIKLEHFGHRQKLSFETWTPKRLSIISGPGTEVVFLGNCIYHNWEIEELAPSVNCKSFYFFSLRSVISGFLTWKCFILLHSTTAPSFIVYNYMQLQTGKKIDFLASCNLGGLPQRSTISQSSDAPCSPPTPHSRVGATPFLLSTVWSRHLYRQPVNYGMKNRNSMTSHRQHGEHQVLIIKWT